MWDGRSCRLRLQANTGGSIFLITLRSCIPAYVCMASATAFFSEGSRAAVTAGGAAGTCPPGAGAGVGGSSDSDSRKSSSSPSRYVRVSVRRVELPECVREPSPVQQEDAPARLCGSVRRQGLFCFFSHPASVWMRLHALQVGWAVYAQLRPVASSAVRPTAAHAAPACTCGASPTFLLQFACQGLSPVRTPATAKGGGIAPAGTHFISAAALEFSGFTKLSASSQRRRVESRAAAGSFPSLPRLARLVSRSSQHRYLGVVRGGATGGAKCALARPTGNRAVNFQLKTSNKLS